MNDPAEERDEDEEPVDERPRAAVPYYDAVRELDARIAEVERRAHGRTIPTDVAEQISLARYAGDVLLHGNASGRHNPTISLPQPWWTRDVIAVIGKPDNAEPGSDAAWRAVRRHYDMAQGGRQHVTGRARGGA